MEYYLLLLLLYGMLSALAPSVWNIICSCSFCMEYYLLLLLLYGILSALTPSIWNIICSYSFYMEYYLLLLLLYGILSALTPSIWNIICSCSFCMEYYLFIKLRFLKLRFQDQKHSTSQWWESLAFCPTWYHNMCWPIQDGFNLLSEQIC